MSTSKNKYFEVSFVKVISAPNKETALKAATLGRPPSGTRVLAEELYADRITSAEAHSIMESLEDN